MVLYLLVTILPVLESFFGGIRATVHDNVLPWPLMTPTSSLVMYQFIRELVYICPACLVSVGLTANVFQSSLFFVSALITFAR